MVQSAAAQQAARCFLALLRDVQSASAAREQHPAGRPMEAAVTAAPHHQQWESTCAGHSHVVFDIEDRIHAKLRGDSLDEEDVGLLLAIDSSDMAAGATQQSRGGSLADRLSALCTCV